MRVFRIGIRQQLIALVLFVAVCSLLILGVITGVYFSENYKSIRAEKLSVIAQLKSSQVTQNLNNLYYQAYYLTASTPIQNALISYRAGNVSEENWYDARSAIEEFLASSNTYTNARLYDTKSSRVVDESNNMTGAGIPSSILESLYPLDSNETLPSQLNTDGILSGPVVNGTSYILSMTLPVSGQASILLDTSSLSGYITIVMRADNLALVVQDLTTLKKGRVHLLAANLDGGRSENSTYQFVVDPLGTFDEDYLLSEFLISDNYIATEVFIQNKTGQITSTKDELGEMVAAGYSPISFKLTRWAAVVEQPKNEFDSPLRKLSGLIAGVCVGTAVFMAIITFPLAHWAVRPVSRLQEATETIAAGRGLRPYSKAWREDQNQKRPPGKPPSSPLDLSTATASGSNFSPNANYGSATEENIYSAENGSTSSGLNSTAHHPTYIGNARVPTYPRFFYDEFSKLTETFNAMTDELDRQYSHLEERVKDRTKQLESAKIQAEAANEAKTVFIANISHELRTPLNGILGMTAIAMAESDVSKIRSSLKLIFRSGELLLHILTELLTFSKNSLKRSKLQNSDFTIMEIALQIKSIFGKLAKDQDVKLAITVVPNECRKMMLYGDSNGIIQIVMNLVSNALKFTPVRGKVSVRIKRIGEYDEEASKKTNYQEVLVKQNSQCFKEISTESSDDSPISPSNTNNETSVSDDNGPNNDISMDNNSIVTTSTSSYDEVIFKSQFRAHTKDPIDDNNLKTTDLPQDKQFVFEFEVEDTGPGIDPKLQKTVFEPFVQGDQTLSRQHGGTGLGLSICRQLATMMHGVMELKSTVDVGSKFTFRVPLTQRKEIIFDNPNDPNIYEDEFNPASKENRKVKIVEPQGSRNTILDAEKAEMKADRQLYHSFLTSTGTAKSSESVSESKSARNSELKILVAEDNSVNQEVIKRMLKLEGFTNIDLAVDGQEAIDLVRSSKLSHLQDTKNTEYHLIFMDVQMPKIDGLMATKIIRTELNYEGPIVALTAFADERNAKECLDVGMTSFLSKPIRRTQLRQVILQSCPFLRNEPSENRNEVPKVPESL